MLDSSLNALHRPSQGGWNVPLVLRILRLMTGNKADAGPMDDIDDGRLMRIERENADEDQGSHHFV